MVQKNSTPLVIALATGPKRDGAPAAQTDSARARGDWKVTFRPYEGPGAETMPVKVTKVDGKVGADGVMFFKSVSTKNLSDKMVSRVQLTMFVYEERKPNKILLHRRWLTFTYPNNTLPAGEEFRSDDRSRVAANLLQGKEGLLQPLVKEDGTLEGNYQIELGVSKVYFYDGSSWVMPEPTWPESEK